VLESATVSEASFWRYLSKLLPRTGTHKIESHDTAAGFPDVHFTLTQFRHHRVEAPNAPEQVPVQRGKRVTA